MCVETYDDLVELVDRLELAVKYNEPEVLFKDTLIPVSDAEAIVKKYTNKGGRLGSKKR